MPTAIVLGAGGQDGRILVEQLRAAGTAVLGIARGSVAAHGFEAHRAPDLTRPIDITRPDDVAEFVRRLRPDAIYHLAAVHQSSEETPADGLDAHRRQYEVNFFSLLNVLEAIRLGSPATRLFFAASSHVFGTPDIGIQDEATPLRPDTIYGMTKTDGLLACRQYRIRHGLFAAAGILYTHESPHRDPKFLAMKIARAAARIKAGQERELVIGRVDAVIDWGWAADYADAMRRILAADRADTFVVATGERRTVRDYLAAAFGSVGLDWQAHVREDAAILTRPSPVRVGNPARLRAATGWAPTVGLEEIARRLVASQVTR